MTSKTFKLSKVALLSAVSFLIMLFDFPVLFLPGFYKLDFSESVVLIAGFALGPTSGIAVELFKNFLKIFIKGTSTAGIGELSNFLIGCCLVLPSSIFYRRNRTKKNALISLALGIIITTIFSALLNLFIFLPLYSTVMSVDLKSFVGENILPYVLLGVIPFNFIKATSCSIICFIVYKRVRLILEKNI